MFFIIDGDKPIYQYNTIQTKQQLKILLSVHSILDSIDYLQIKKTQCYLGHVLSQDPMILSYLTLTNLKLILLFQISRKDFNREIQDRVKNFFEKVNQYLSIVLMNPLYNLHTQINSQSFDLRIKEYMNKKLGTLIQKK